MDENEIIFKVMDRISKLSVDKQKLYADRIQKSVGGTDKVPLYYILRDIDTETQSYGGDSILNQVFGSGPLFENLPEDFKKNVYSASKNTPSGGFDISYYVNQPGLSQYDKNSRDLIAANATIQSEKSNQNTAKISRSIRYTVAGIPKVDQAVKLSKEYQEQLNRKLENGDALQTITVAPCPGIDMEKSPYEVFRRAYEAWITRTGPKDPYTGVQNPPTIDELTSGMLDDREYVDWKNQPGNEYYNVGRDISAYFNEKTGQGLDPDLFVRGERLAEGTPITLDLGTFGGTYSTENGSKNPKDIEKEANNKGIKTLAEYVEDKINFFNPPSEIYHLLNGVTDESGHALDENGKPLDYDYPGIDPASRKPQELTPEEKELRFKIALKKLEPDLIEFMSEFNAWKEESEKLKETGEHAYNFLKKLKPGVLAAFFTGATIIELHKWDKITQTIVSLNNAGKPVPSLGWLYHHIGHDLSQMVGYAEAILGIFKFITNVSNGKTGDTLRDAAVSIIAALGEWAPKLIGLEILGTIGAGGFVGLILTVITTYMDFVGVPQSKEKDDKLLNTVLDLERMWIEKKCCIRIHPQLYRKSKGQILIPIVTSDDPNSITGIALLAGDSYGVGWEPGTQQSMPCVQGGVTKSPKKVTATRRSSNMFKSTDASKNTLPPIDVKVEPINQPDNQNKCDEPTPVDGAKAGEPDKMSLNDAIPGWNKAREEDYQNTILTYNMNYLQNEYNRLMEGAYCRAGIIPESENNGYIDPSYKRGNRLPLDTGGRVRLRKSELVEPLGRLRGNVTVWEEYWTEKYKTENTAAADRIRRRGIDYGGGRGGRGGKKPSDGEDLGDVPVKV